MSNFFYKNLAISTITTTTGSNSSAPGYPGFPVVPTSYTGLQPNDFLYYYTDSTGTQQPVSDLCTAAITTINASTTNQSVPSGCKSFYVIAVGGSAGGCGGGGTATGNYPGVNPTQGAGGSGGAGGGGGTAIGSFTTNSGNISITIGTGGNAGGVGNSNTADAFSGQLTPESTQSGGGQPGKVGNSTEVIYDKQPALNASGGNVGNIGGGCNADYDPYTWNSNQGASGSPGKTPALVNPYNLNFPVGAIAGGNGGFYNGSANNYDYQSAKDGSSGYAQIIWLYDD
jgi:hypothetical protein